jgi:hypothetical protein
MEEKGLTALQEKILDTYEKEKALDVVKTTLSDKELKVEVSACPGVSHLRATGREVSSWYVYTTTVVMEALAQKIGAKFSMDSYDEATGKATYRISMTISKRQIRFNIINRCAIHQIRTCYIQHRSFFAIKLDFL